MSVPTADAHIAVLVDFENVGLESLPWLLNRVAGMGRIIIRRAYADWSARAGVKRERLLDLGIEPVHHFRATRTAKNSSDICLAVDAVDLLYNAPIDTFVIVSSDSDFLPLFQKLRAAGKHVIGAGRKSAVARTLAAASDDYIDLEQAGKQPPLPAVQAKLVVPLETPQPEMGPEGTPAATMPWDIAVDDAWSQRLKDPSIPIPGPQAADDAAKVLKVAKLSDSKYKSLQGLMEASPYLRDRWTRDANNIIRR